MLCNVEKEKREFQLGGDGYNVRQRCRCLTEKNYIETLSPETEENYKKPLE